MPAKIKAFSIVACLLFFISCKKFVEIPPPSFQVIGDQVFASDGTATSAVVGIYSEMIKSSTSFSASSTTLFCGLYADELQNYSPNSNDAFMNSNLTEADHVSISVIFWVLAYKYIYSANLCLEKLSSSTISPSVRNMLIGESEFVRAFCFFTLVNLFGDVPLTTSSDYRVNAILPRTPAMAVWDQIIADLADAKSRLVATYTGSDRGRPNKWAATALLARAYLYTGQWAKAEAEATELINAGMYGLNSNLNNVFIKSSNETIWQLQPVNMLWNTWEGKEILPATSSTPPTYLVHPNLLSAFEANDQRKTSWVATRTYLGQSVSYPYKYKVYGNGAPVTEYYVVLRLAEQFLIRAEARAKQNNIAGAQSDLNTIRARAGLPNTTANDQTSLATAIEQERRVELFAEWGHRWFDLKRTNRADAVIGALKPTTWQPVHVLWPIPVNQILANPALTQNPGY